MGTNTGFIPTDNETNMGDADTLIGFANYCIDEYFHGERLGLVIWGHGGGWIGTSLDKGDYLETSELITGLQEINAKLGREIDLIAFDACSMGSLEVLSSFSGLASFAVVSELQIPASGFPYDAILARISLDPSMSTPDLAFCFVDEYVKYGTLIVDITSQAAVIDLAKLGSGSPTFNEFSNASRLFNPIEHDSFSVARNSSAGIDGIASIDVVSYLERLYSAQNISRRLLEKSVDASVAISAAVVNNRVHISDIDMDTYEAFYLHGIAIYFPENPVPLDAYQYVSPLSNIWADFLGEFYLNGSYQLPASNLDLNTKDLKYADGLDDSFEFSWNNTPEIEVWEFDMYESGDWEILLSQSEDDESLEHTITTAEAGYYLLYAYGRDSQEKYREYVKFDDVVIFRQISFIVQIPASIDFTETDLRITNLRTGDISNMRIEERSPILKLTIPEPNEIGDSILLELYRGSALLASGLLILDGSALEIQLYDKPGPSSILIFLVAIITSFLIAFASIRFLSVGEESGINFGSLKKRIKKKASPSEIRLHRTTEPPSERASSVEYEDREDKTE